MGKKPYYVKDNDGYKVDFDNKSGARKYARSVGGSAYKKGSKKPFYQTKSATWR